jgi:MFS superfamily sulfate permease-like transporter
VTNPRNDKYWMLAALVFGLLALPLLVHQTGLRVFGEYAGGGATNFLGDFLHGLVTLRWYTWLLALGPLAIVATWRGVCRLNATGD